MATHIAFATFVVFEDIGKHRFARVGDVPDRPSRPPLPVPALVESLRQQRILRRWCGRRRRRRIGDTARLRGIEFCNVMKLDVGTFAIGRHLAIGQSRHSGIGRIETASSADQLPLANSQPRSVIVHKPVGLVEPSDAHIFVTPEDQGALSRRMFKIEARSARVILPDMRASIARSDPSCRMTGSDDAVSPRSVSISGSVSVADKQPESVTARTEQKITSSCRSNYFSVRRVPATIGIAKLLRGAQHSKSPKEIAVDRFEVWVAQAAVSLALRLPDGTGIGPPDYLCRAVATTFAVAAQCRVEAFGPGERVGDRRYADDLVVPASCASSGEAAEGSLNHPVSAERPTRTVPILSGSYREPKAR